MVTPVAVAGVGLGILTAAVFGALAVRSKRFDEPGSWWFAVLLCVYGLVPLTALIGWYTLELAGLAPADAIRVGYLGSLWLTLAATPVWFLFALHYIGRISRTPTWMLLALLAPLPVFLYHIPAQADLFRPPGARIVGNLLQFAFFTLASMAGIAGYLILRTTYRYGHLRITQGVTLVAGIVVSFVGIRLTLVAQRSGGSPELQLTVLSLAFLGLAGLFAVALIPLDMFDSTPAAGNIGERAIARDTDDVIVVTDHRNRIIKVNEAAADALGVSTTEHHGDPLESLLGHTVADLQDKRTVPLQTTAGKREFDPQVTELTDQHGRWLGYLVSLRDVTDREIREQRLEVLNRVLRHNLRNKLNVVRGRADTVADDLDDPELVGHLEQVVDTADYLADLGEKAGEVESVLADAGTATDPVRLDALLAETTDRIRANYPRADVEIDDLPGGALHVDRDLLDVALYNLVENAIEHADGDPWVSVTATVDPGADYPTRIAVADDGPGIPENETRVIREGTETVLEHGTGLGLWVTNWAVTELGGELAFSDREPRGTVVSVHLPQAPTSVGAGTPPDDGAPAEPAAPDATE